LNSWDQVTFHGYVLQFRAVDQFNEVDTNTNNKFKLRNTKYRVGSKFNIHG
jgi:hypothetical protein